MTLYKISDRHPNYRDIFFEGGDLKGMDVYSAERVNVGSVEEILIDDDSIVRYLVVALKANRRILLPIRSCARTTDPDSLYVRDLDSEDISRLPIHVESMQATVTTNTSADASSGALPGKTVPVKNAIESLTSMLNESAQSSTETAATTDNSSISLYEECISTHKRRIKTGEVKISKQIITETVETETPIQKEKIIIEIESIYSTPTKVRFDDAQVAEDGSIRMGIYEEQTEVCHQVQPYQTVSIKKEIVEDIVRTKETLRREELTVESAGQADVELLDR